MQYFLDLFFPRVSLSGAEGEYVTQRELQALRSFPVIIDTPELRRSRVRFVDRIVAATTYQSSPDLREAIRRFKYQRVQSIHSSLAELLLPAASLINVSNDCVLCPVPLHWSRRFSRGFNQSDLLAQVIAQSKQYSVQQLLRRTRPTGHQAHRAHEERWDAVRDAFAVIVRDVPTHVVLVVDLATTGSNLNPCGQALKDGEGRQGEALVIAKG